MRVVLHSWLCLTHSSGKQPFNKTALLLLCLMALAGCHSNSSPIPKSAHEAAAPQADLGVQQDAAYQKAVAEYRSHHFQQALAEINTLLAKPQYASSPADHAFLLHQQAICRHAIDPRVASDSPAGSFAHVLPAHAPLTAAQADCGPRALLLLCSQFGIHTDLETLRQRAGTTVKGTTMQGLAQAAHSVGLKAQGVQVDRLALAQISVPAIAWYDGNHYVAVLSVAGDTVTIRDPNHAKEEDIPTNELLGRSGGFLLTLAKA